jgi:prevent-host-death family protein
MRTITATAFRARIGSFVDAASAGERIVIERNHKPIAVLLPYADKARLEADDRRRVTRSGGRVDPAK